MILSDALDVRLAGAQVCLALQTSAQANFYGYGSTTISRALTGTIQAYKYGAGVVTFSGANTYTLGTYIVSGTLTITDITALPSFNINGKVYVASGATLAVYNAVTDAQIVAMLGTTNFKAGSAIGFDTTSGARTYSNVIANTSQGILNIVKLGANTLTLSGTNTYTGATKIVAGTLATSNGFNIPDASAVEISSGATLTLGGSRNEVIASLAGAGTCACGANTLTIGGSNNTNFSGTLTSTLSSSTSLYKNGTGTQTFSGTVTIPGYILFNTGTVTLSGAFTQTLGGTSPRSIQLAASASNTFTLNVTNSATFPGLMFGENNGGTSTINVSAGTLAISGQVWMSGVLSTLNVSGGAMTCGSYDIGGGGGTTTSIINLSGGTLTFTGSFRWGAGGVSATSVFNLDGGTFVCTAWVRNAGTNTFNFNGGTFKNTSTLTITQPLISCLIKAGGAIFGNTAILVWDTVLANASGVTGNLTMTGSSTLILSQANTYSGSTTISSGTLQIGNNGTTGSVGASSGITNNSSLVFARSNTLTQGTDFPAISGSGSVMQAGSGTTILSSANTYAGNTTISAGNLRLSHANGFGTLGEIRFLGGTLQYGAGISNDISARIRNNASTMRVDTNAQSVSFANLDSTNSGGLIKSGTGTLTFTGASNTFTGALIISGGELAFSGSYTAVSSVSVNGTTPTLTLTGTFTQTYTGSGVRSFQIAANAGTSGIANVGAGANVTLNGGLMLGDNNGGNGTMNVSAGSITSLQGAWLAGASCLLNVSGGTFTAQSIECGGGTGAGTVTVSGSGTVTAGSLVLCRGNSASVSAVINLNGGTLLATGVGHVTTARSATINFNGGTFTPSNTLALPSTLTTVVKAGGALLNVTGAYLLTIPSALTTDGGGGGLTKSGTGSLTLSGATTYTGSTSILAGTLTKSFSSGALSNAVFTNTTLTANFNATPTNGATYQIFAGATTQSYASVTVTGAAGVVCSYTSATSTLTIVSGGI